MPKHLNIVVKGIVQGVSFRANTRVQAEKLALRGFVKNQYDGSVYIEVEGEDDNLHEFVSWCHKGSTPARIESVAVFEGEWRDFQDFVVLY